MFKILFLRTQVEVSTVRSNGVLCIMYNALRVIKVRINKNQHLDVELVIFVYLNLSKWLVCEFPVKVFIEKK